jgi:hypothetical protein
MVGCALGAVGDAHAQAGWYLTPSITVTEEFDDNVFGTSRSREGDAISRITPTLGFGYRSAPFTLLGTASGSAEVFALHSDLDGLNRKLAKVEAEARPDQNLTLRLQGMFIETESPTELTGDLGLQLGRRSTTQTSIIASAGYRFDRRLSGEVLYSFTDDSAGGVTNTVHDGRFPLVWQATRRDSASLTYHFRRGETDGQAIASDSVLGGWIRRISETTTLGAELGPRWSITGLDFDASARLAHRLSNGELALRLDRSEATVVGRRGSPTINTVAADVSLRPRDALVVSFSPHVGYLTGAGPDTTTYGADFTVRYQVARRIWIVGQYRLSFQEEGSTDILRNIVSVGLEFSIPTRLY